MAVCHFTETDVMTALMAYYALTPSDTITYDAKAGSAANFSGATINLVNAHADIMRMSTTIQGGKIPFIKEIRTKYGFGLKDSKDIADDCLNWGATWGPDNLKVFFDRMGVKYV